MGTKETALATHTTKARTQNPDDNIQMHQQLGTKVLTGPYQLKKQHKGQYAI